MSYVLNPQARYLKRGIYFYPKYDGRYNVASGEPVYVPSGTGVELGHTKGRKPLVSTLLGGFRYYGFVERQDLSKRSPHHTATRRSR